MNDLKFWDGSAQGALSVGAWLGKDVVITVKSLCINLGKSRWLVVYPGEFVARNDSGDAWVETALFKNL